MIKFGITLLITLAALIQDLKKYKISNQLILAGMVAAMLFIFVEVCRGGDVKELFLGGIGVFVVLYGIYMIGGIGAGDVKLLTVIGFLVGKKVVWIAATAFLAAAGLGAVGLLFQKLEQRKVTVLEVYKVNLHIMHFSIAIFIGELIVMYVCIV